VTATLLDGAALARTIRDNLKPEVDALIASNRRPGLGVILAGDDPASAVYVRNKTKACAELGIHHDTITLPATATTAEVLARVREFNERDDIHGILVQLPLPKGVDAQAVLDAVLPQKDVDGFHPENVGRLVQKRARFVACTPAGVMELLKASATAISGGHAVVVGRSDIVGKPMSLLLLHKDATVTICHSRTTDLPSITRQADILVAAIGRPGAIRAEHVKPGAVVIDVGINRITDAAVARDLLDPERLAAFATKGTALVGDVHFPQVREVASAITPVPGGVGPLTIALLMKNTVAAANRH
jgi:methylenetetrahydrofolate dehydrogenase (NADP+) / methenyltetrahydrofolate cyclohydrolase